MIGFNPRITSQAYDKRILRVVWNKHWLATLYRVYGHPLPQMSRLWQSSCVCITLKEKVCEHKENIVTFYQGSEPFKLYLSNISRAFTLSLESRRRYLDHTHPANLAPYYLLLCAWSDAIQKRAAALRASQHKDAQNLLAFSQDMVAQALIDPQSISDICHMPHLQDLVSPEIIFDGTANMPSLEVADFMRSPLDPTFRFNYEMFTSGQSLYVIHDSIISTQIDQEDSGDEEDTYEFLPKKKKYA